MKAASLGLLLLFSSPQEKAEIVTVRKIWDQGPHNAFTDLLRFKDRWFCVFREGAGHESPDGILRVISSADGEAWSSEAAIAMKGADLRDAKITVAPDGRLMLSGAAAYAPGGKVAYQSFSWFSRDGRTWDEGIKVAEPEFWLWRVTWHKGAAYGIGYGCTDKNKFVRLYSSKEGAQYKVIVPILFDKGYPNETSLLFLDDDTCLCLLRRDEAEKTAQMGVSKPPYTKWTWKDLKAHLGGPPWIRLPDGRIIAAGRFVDGGWRTSLAWIDASSMTLKEFLKLPSGGDTSYPGLVWHDGMLWVSSYSSHEGKTSIYLAKVKLPSSK